MDGATSFWIGHETRCCIKTDCIHRGGYPFILIRMSIGARDYHTIGIGFRSCQGRDIRGGLIVFSSVFDKSASGVGTRDAQQA
ncbi:hypothetical protein WM40_02465 [Robbsia andropogonis]|uniref:Uncharacterized protein n=1 Tax=Robbsia andropogonis TaxID=28092 RepID=A0A0F5K470_9BURK|nr:hypothetical protein WM40_02465 [Robbsia andropogonis]